MIVARIIVVLGGSVFGLISVSGQTLTTECVHRDSADHVIYLEREYRHADTLVYFMAYSDGGRVLKSSKRSSGDTLIESFRCHELEPGIIPKLGEMQAMFSDDELIVQTSNDPMWVSILDGSLITLRDTALTNQQGERFLELYRRSTKEYASMIFANDLQSDLSTAELREVSGWSAQRNRGHGQWSVRPADGIQVLLIPQ